MDLTLTSSLPRLSAHLEAIRELCRAHGVTRLDVFGSALIAAFDPARSDIDFVVEYDPKTDLVMTGGFRNPCFIRAVNQTQRQLHAA